jgi:hypothetical protein
MMYDELRRLSTPSSTADSRLTRLRGKNLVDGGRRPIWKWGLGAFSRTLTNSPTTPG